MKINQITEGYKVLPPIDKEKYQDRKGLEGPFRLANGKVVYYDDKEGSYYDPDTDMYISYDDYKEMDKDRDFNEGEKHGNSKVYDKCWKGYKKVPGKKRGEKGSCVKEDELNEGPLVLNREVDLLRMLDSLLDSWKSGSHTDEEYEALLNALGYKMEKEGDRTVLTKESLEEGTTAEVYKTNGKYWVVDVTGPKIKYTDWGPRGDGFASKEDAEAFAKKVTKEGLEEAPGAIRKGLAAVALIAGLWGVNDHMAQQAYDASPQLQKLTAYLEVAKEHNDQRMIKQLEQRIENHKARLDLGKSDVMGKDGKPIDVVYDKKRGRNI